MVLSNNQTLVLNKNHRFSKTDIDILTNMNSLLNPLKIFSHGFPNNVETQEGFSVF